ncbi:hypothetical protein [Labrys monachus]|uniref:Uncharacterized protein n=1 Tax=Labrys monachus TaxID=217067 RepID=A0ABU0FAU6_9HYPH|nr:hypothetical protein [Labrys monachus]MDQ0391188.1 hypothetical protein [Labrys monachus]
MTFITHVGEQGRPIFFPAGRNDAIRHFQEKSVWHEIKASVLHQSPKPMAIPFAPDDAIPEMGGPVAPCWIGEKSHF